MALVIPTMIVSGEKEARVRRAMAATGAKTPREYFETTLVMTEKLIDRASQNKATNELRATAERPNGSLEELAR